MDIDVFFSQEKENDGQSIFLYYDRIAGVYLAFGLSAYFTTLITEPFLSYSEVIQVPVAILSRKHVLYLRQSLHIADHQVKNFYHFKLKSFVGNAGYEKWSHSIKELQNLKS